MKKLIDLLCILLLQIQGVSGAETDVIQSVSVLEGDSVTLHAGETQKEDLTVWTYGPDNTVIVFNSEIKMFKDRLLVDQSTGSLTIENITANFSGIYKLNIVKRNSYKTFNVSVYDCLPVPVISINSSQCSSSSSSSQQNCSLVCSLVNVGHVTLSWYKGNSLLSSISVSDLSISLSLPLEVEYQDKNSYSCVINNPISNQTTHLTITQLCHTCSAQGLSVGVIVAMCGGLLLLVAGGAVFYCCSKKRAKAKENDQTPMEQAIPLNNGMFHSEPDQVKKIQAKQGQTITLNTGVTKIQRDDQLRWKYADSRVTDSTTSFRVIAVGKEKTNKFSVNNGPGRKFKDRLELDHQTGNLTIKNIEVTDTGHFKVEIKSNTNPLTKTIKVNVLEEDPNNTTTYTLELTDTDEATDEELS
uniref:Ig-like domain-containing protein n=1 Tax=Cyprinus carpio carpio TaxID=630221 RepID=A0A9J7XFN2_CYPCA